MNNCNCYFDSQCVYFVNQLNDKVIEEETKLKIKEERVGITNKIKRIRNKQIKY